MLLKALLEGAGRLRTRIRPVAAEAALAELPPLLLMLPLLLLLPLRLLEALDALAKRRLVPGGAMAAPSAEGVAAGLGLPSHPRLRSDVLPGASAQLGARLALALSATPHRGAAARLGASFDAAASLRLLAGRGLVLLASGLRLAALLLGPRGLVSTRAEALAHRLAERAGLLAAELTVAVRVEALEDLVEVGDALGRLRLVGLGLRLLDLALDPLSTAPLRALAGALVLGEDGRRGQEGEPEQAR